jgi:hypothetical protein
VGSSAQRGWPQNGQAGTIATTSKLKAKSTTRSGLTIHHLRHVSDKRAADTEAALAHQDTLELLSNMDLHDGDHLRSTNQSATLHALQRPTAAARNPAQFEAFRHLISNSSSNMALAAGGTSPGLRQRVLDNTQSQASVR